MSDERRERWLKLRVGVFVLLALLAFLGMIYALGARARLFEAHYTLHADFTEVGGLTEGATVRLAGVQIGRVTGVHLPSQPGGKVRVDLTIAARYADRIRADSQARIETQGLLGDKIVEITVGSVAAPPVGPGQVLAAKDPLDLGRVLHQGAATVEHVAALAEALRVTAEAFGRTTIVEDVAASTAAARRTTEQLARLIERVERGPSWAHALLYEEPVALARLNALAAAAERVLERVERGEGALGVLTSPTSTAAARKLVAAMERLGALAEGPRDDQGLLAALLFDPRSRALLDDLQAATRALRELSERVARLGEREGEGGALAALLFDPGTRDLLEGLRRTARNLQEVSDRIVGGRGTLGSLVRDEPTDPALQAMLADLRVAVANLRELTERVREGEGTLGALLVDPTLYERLAALLDGARRSVLLRALIRGLGKDAERGR